MLINQLLYYLLLILFYGEYYKINANVVHQIFDLISTQAEKEQFKLWHYILRKPYDINTQYAVERYIIFKENLLLINQTNEKKLPYKLGLGPFTDYTKEEFMSLFTSKHSRASTAIKKPSSYKKHFVSLKDLSSNALSNDVPLNGIDWSYLFEHRKAKNQFSCKVCWIFAAVASIEAQIEKLYNNSSLLSEQHVVDCIENTQEIDICLQGNTVDYALDFIVENGGIAGSLSYPYVIKRETCNKKVSNIVSIESYIICEKKQNNIHTGIKECNETYIRHIINNAPYASDIEVIPELAHYREGKFIADSCNDPNHSVLVVFYDNEKFKIRNSWGVYWGTLGYGFIDKETKGMKGCGLMEYAYQPRGVKLLNN